MERKLHVCMDGEPQEMMMSVGFESCDYNLLTEQFFIFRHPMHIQSLYLFTTSSLQIS
jgi:hypothetical protein